MRRLLSIGLAAAGMAVLSVPARGDDWPQWRGLTRQGLSAEKGIPDSFPEGGLKLLWKSEKIARDGYGTHTHFQNGSPLVAFGKVYVQAVPGKGREALFCFDLATGKKEWEHDLLTGRQAEGCTSNGTPLIDVPAGRIYAAPSSARSSPAIYDAPFKVACLDARSGKSVWVADAAKTGLPDEVRLGCAAPVACEDLIIFAGKKAVALKKETGQLAWVWPEKFSPARQVPKEKGYDTAYHDAMDPTEIVEIYATCSPFIITVGQEPVVVLEVKRNADCCYTTSLVGLKARTGEQVWIGPRMGSHLTSALAGEVMVTTAFDMSRHYSHPMEMIALKFHWEGKALKSQTLWQTTGSLGGNRYRMTSPLAAGGRVYSGFNPLRCFDLATGKVLWAVKEVDSGGWGLSSPVLADGNKVIVVSDKGALHVVKDESAAGKLLHTQQVCGRIGATPAIADGRLILRDYEHGLYCYELKPSSLPSAAGKKD